ncbi:Hypothetical predicted protein [Pelobates cultripes]|uniref:Uncharacterized protein n=1 Tax=Pelobates cultripes TaxID=61616 RepID=A0AAD1VUY6_PELCU|nr:Hypothetical predicted protein [Pelobates cultripes]
MENRSKALKKMDELPEQGQATHRQELLQPNSTDDMLQRIDRALERFWQQLEARMMPTQLKPHQRQCTDEVLRHPDLLMGKSNQAKPETHPQVRGGKMAAASKLRSRQRKLCTRNRRKTPQAPHGTEMKQHQPHT